MDKIDPRDAKKNLDRLTSRQLDILRLRCEGLEWQAIAKQLVMAKSTVSAESRVILSRLHVDEATESGQLTALLLNYAPLLENQEEKAGPGKATRETPGPYSTPRTGSPIPNVIDAEAKSVRNPVQPNPEPPRPSWRLVRWFALCAVLGIALGAVLVYLALRPTSNPLSLLLHPTGTQLSPTSVQSATALPASTTQVLTQTPYVIVVTATQSPATEVPTLTALPQPAMLFADNFDQGLSGSWSVVSGNPVVVNGQLTDGEDSWLRLGDDSWTDYAVELDIRSPDCWFYQSWNAVGIRVQNLDNMIAFKLANCEFEWDVVKNGNWSTVPNSYVHTATFDNIKVVVSVQGNQFAAEINGERVASFINSDFTQGGVEMKIAAKTLVDNLKITSIQK